MNDDGIEPSNLYRSFAMIASKVSNDSTIVKTHARPCPFRRRILTHPHPTKPCHTVHCRIIPRRNERGRSRTVATSHVQNHPTGPCHAQPHPSLPHPTLPLPHLTLPLIAVCLARPCHARPDRTKPFLEISIRGVEPRYRMNESLPQLASPCATPPNLYRAAP